MKRAVRTLISLVLVMGLASGYSVAATKKKPQPQTAIARKNRSIWRVVLVPLKYTFAGLLRLKLNSKGEPYE